MNDRLIRISQIMTELAALETAEIESTDALIEEHDLRIDLHNLLYLNDQISGY